MNVSRQLSEPVVETLWRTMKMLRQFTPRELADAAAVDGRTVTASTAAAYCARLAGAGVLSGPAAPKPQHRLTVPYRVIRNVGGSAPRVVTLEAVFDPNAGEFINQATTVGAIR